MMTTPVSLGTELRTTTEMNDQEPSLHDWISLGEIDLALALGKEESKEDLDARRNDEIRRLPLLLRMLSASQPLASIPSVTNDSEQQEEGFVPDPWVDQVVSRLENVSAAHSAAEVVDAMTLYHAPNITRKISRLAPLKRDKRTLEWNTKDLAAVAASPLGPLRKKRRQSEGLPVPANDTGGITDEDDVMSIDEAEGGCSENDASSAAVGGEANTVSDSQEARTMKGLSEVARLVVSSLQPAAESNEDDDRFPSLSLPITTGALLSEPLSNLNEASKAGAVGGCDLSATVCAVMHHSPVLRHRHVANALCRSSAPQAIELIVRMGANCPSAVPCLLRGCIDAFAAASHDDIKAHAAIVRTAKLGVRALATSLSHRESIRARTILQQSDVMVDIQLELALDQDPVAAACLLNKHFSTYAVLDQKDIPKETDEFLQCEGAMQRSSDVLPEASSKLLTIQLFSQLSTRSKKDDSLKRLLEDNSALRRKAFTCILDELQNCCVAGNPAILSGRTSIFLRAFSFLVLFGGSWQDDEIGNLFLLDRAMNVLSALRNAIFKDGSEKSTVPGRSENDNYYQYLVCTCLLIHARVAITAGYKQGLLADAASKCLDCVFDNRSLSLKSDVFSSKIALLLTAHNGSGVLDVILHNLTERNCEFAPHEAAMDDGFSRTCEAACALSNLNSIIESGISVAAATEDLSALLQYIQTEGSFQQADEFVRNVLLDPKKSIKALCSDGICELFRSAVTNTKTKERNAVPCILPLALQSLSLKIDWRKDGTRLSQPLLEGQYLLQTLFSLYFVDDKPSGSPFAIDPRDLPLKESLELARILSEEHNVAPGIEAELQRLVEKLAPEISFQVDTALALERSANPNFITSTSVQATRLFHSKVLKDAIRDCTRNKSKDPSGVLAEKAYVSTSHVLTLSHLTLTAAQALVGLPNVPSPFMSYPGLCKDPLVLLKAPLSVWRCKGLRRIALHTLSYLLRANDNIITCVSPSEGTVAEILMSRDAIIVKCLIMASTGDGVGKDRLPPFTDFMLVGMVREMVAKHSGLVAQLISRGGNDMMVDWIVEYVPESMGDAETFMMLLSERSSLTTAEKLETASAALRIAIAHGGQNAAAAKALTYAALTSLLSSFFLVIGPVGVSVFALDGEEGTDVTQVCRNAMFRMLTALQNVGRGSVRQGLLSESGLVLQKVSNLCKGESIMTGVTGVVAGARKKLLKDIYEAIAKAANSMGTAIKL